MIKTLICLAVISIFIPDSRATNYSCTGIASFALPYDYALVTFWRIAQNPDGSFVTDPYAGQQIDEEFTSWPAFIIFWGNYANAISSLQSYMIGWVNYTAYNELANWPAYDTW